MRAVPFDDPAVSGGSLANPSAGTAAITGRYLVGEEEVRPAFELIRAHFKQFTPEWAAELTSIPAETIRRLANELVEAAQIGSTININGVTFPYRPAVVFAGRGAISHRGGNNVMLAGNLLNGLLGATDVPGGLTGESFNPLPQPGADGTVEPQMRLIPRQANGSAMISIFQLTTWTWRSFIRTGTAHLLSSGVQLPIRRNIMWSMSLRR